MQEIIQETLKYLKAGKTILYPTDTIWGIGCDATRAKAVQKVYKIKQRVASKSLIVLLDSAEKLSDYMKNVPEVAYDLIGNMDTPLTIIYPDAIGLAKNVIARDKSIAIRIVKNEFCKELIKQFGKPIVSTSANLTSEPTPLTFSKISEQIKNKVDYTVNLYQNSVNIVKPSTIIKFGADGEFEIIRR
jgi:L-threonylcarbamoyladenylate synthase